MSNPKPVNESTRAIGKSSHTCLKRIETFVGLETPNISRLKLLSTIQDAMLPGSTHVFLRLFGSSTYLECYKSNNMKKVKMLSFLLKSTHDRIEMLSVP